MNITAPAGAKQITVEYQVIRADGTVEGTRVVYWHKNPLKRLAFRVKNFGKN